MKKRISFKKLSVLAISILLLTVCLCGCGGGTNDGAEVAGKTETWGNITVLVPDGMTLVPGDLTDDKNENALTIQDNKEAFKYFTIAIRDEDSINMGMDMTKDMNSECTFTDVELKPENGTFTGYSYTSSDVVCVQLKGAVGDKFVQVGSAGFASDDQVLNAVIASIVLK